MARKLGLRKTKTVWRTTVAVSCGKKGSSLKSFCSLIMAACITATLHAQAAVPVFHFSSHGHQYTLVGNSPAKGGATRIPVVLVPVTLSFAGQGSKSPVVFHASADVASVLHSPLFKSFSYPSGERTQYADALLRASVPHASSWHTLLESPKIDPVAVTIPAADGYTLYSRKSGRRIAVVDLNFLVHALFKRLPPERGKLVVAFADNTTFYALSDATVCCSWGAHGVDPATGDSFVLSAVLHDPPTIVRDRDVQPLTQQIAEFLYDPLHDPLYPGSFRSEPGNHFPAWRRPSTGGCGGGGVGSNYYQLEPTDTNLKNDFPESTPYSIGTSGQRYHVENVALLPWYLEADKHSAAFSFPDVHVLTSPASPCAFHPNHHPAVAHTTPAANSAPANGPRRHWLVGYWVSRAFNGKRLPLRDVSPRWDVVIVSFASPVADAPEGTFRFQAPQGTTPSQFKAEIAYLKSRGQKVMISLGGGGQFVHLGDPAAEPRFVHSIEHIVSKWGFDGIDIDFESPSLELAPGDTDFRHPITPSIVHLIAALRQLHQHFGPKFMISLVPEGTQIPAGYRTYGGQFGTYLPIVYALRNILTFVDVQDYNTPPLEGLDGEIYQVHTVSYYAAMTELLLHGFPVAGNSKEFFPGLPARQVVTGFLVNYSDPSKVSAAMHFIISGKAPGACRYHLVKQKGYPHFLGAMFWNIDDDWADGNKYSGLIGPQLHGKHP